LSGRAASTAGSGCQRADPRHDSRTSRRHHLNDETATPLAILGGLLRLTLPPAGKTARFLALVTEREGSLASIPLHRVAGIAADLASQADLNVGAARIALRRSAGSARRSRCATASSIRRCGQAGTAAGSYRRDVPAATR
jgi:hypothetical protein